MKITITEAISKLKTTEKKITKVLSTIALAGIKDSKNKVNSKYEESEFLTKSKSDFQSLTDLEKVYMTLKEKIAKSNATTTVKIGDKTYTIVEAIERKKRIDEELRNYNKLLRTIDRTIEQAETKNEDVRYKIDNLLDTKLGADSKNQKADDIISLKDKLFDADKVEAVYDKNLYKSIEQRIEDIETFKEEVDVALSIVNAKTEIEVEL